jgi:hypothetical protein
MDMLTMIKLVCPIAAAALLGLSGCGGGETSTGTGGTTSSSSGGTSTTSTGSSGGPTLQDCSTVSAGQALVPSGKVSMTDSSITITLSNNVGGWKTTPQISAVSGGTLSSVMLDSGDGIDVFVVIAPTAGATSGGFTLTGTMVGYETGMPACDVTRTFTYSVANGAVSVM